MILRTFNCANVNQIKNSKKLYHTRVDVKEFLQANEVSPGPAVYHPLKIRFHTEFVWLSFPTHPDCLLTPTAGSGTQTFCWNFEWKFPENPSFPSYCVLELTN